VRKKILFLSQTLPFPPDGGAKLRTFNVIRQLLRDFDVTILAFARRKKGFGSEDITRSLAGLRDITPTEAFRIEQEYNPLRLVTDHVGSVLSMRVYTAFVFASAKFRRRLSELLSSENFDAVHLDSLDLARYAALCAHRPITCTHHDAQSLLLRRRAALQQNPLLKAYMLLQSRLMAREEASYCPLMSVNFTVSPDDARVLRGVAPEASFEVIPNGVDTGYFTPGLDSSEGIVFVGGTSWFPNRDALAYYVERILPRLRDGGVNDTTHWVGRIQEKERERFEGIEQLRLHGYVPDVRPYIAQAGCYVVPIRVGGGTRVKILDAWAMGKAVVSTAVGCEGLQAVDGKNILIRDEPEDFAAAIRDVLRDSELRRSLGRSARRTAEDVYSWDCIGETLRGSYWKVIRGDR
jgi:polysaccharide biosynthesis protein PslH